VDCKVSIQASMVYQFHNIEILQLLLMSMLIELIAELVAAAAAAAVPVAFAASVEDIAIDMVEDDRSTGCIPVFKRYLPSLLE
jgi:hypothetical protein